MKKLTNMNVFLPMYEILIKLFFITIFSQRIFFIIEYYYGIKGISVRKIIIMIII